ncbi:hypothetical protein BST99_02325 [Aureicoccus marinus]|uniref:Uncharacterized protein n=1 Tax=Aureicoccus marinus TaxID=754435 RepID=A0A2S7T502_9FLAO|nr:hypothetical protein BST99_02325 [Aureicoccus marinus]
MFFIKLDFAPALRLGRNLKGAVAREKPSGLAAFVFVFYKAGKRAFRFKKQKPLCLHNGFSRSG